MQHEIPVENAGPQGEEMARAVEACVHCGFCLPTCPTYKVMGEEMDSPRGRIFLMKEVLQGSLPAKEAEPYIDACLGCQACVTACPSGVHYGELISPYRAWTEKKRNRKLLDRLQRFFIMETLPYPGRFRVAALAGRAAKPFRRILPNGFGAMLELLPDTLPKAEALPALFPAQGKKRARVMLLPGCAQQVLAPNINWATLRVLSKNGVEVVLPRTQTCCGSLAMHIGEEERALMHARQTLKAIPTDIDAVISNASGCGSGIKEYPLLFKGKPEKEEAQLLAEKLRDVSTFLDEIGPVPFPENIPPLKVAYHDACHLAHAQGIRAAPRRLLESIPNLTLLEPTGWEICCGSAGTYNIEHPEVARKLGEQKIGNILQTGAEAVATGNIGCITQIQNHLKAVGQPLPVYHTIELLDRALSQGSSRAPSH